MVYYINDDETLIFELETPFDCEYDNWLDGIDTSDIYGDRELFDRFQAGERLLTFQPYEKDEHGVWHMLDVQTIYDMNISCFLENDADSTAQIDYGLKRVDGLVPWFYNYLTPLDRRVPVCVGETVCEFESCAYCG